MKQIHWNKEDGIWYDYDLDHKSHRREYYISNALPLFAHCYDDDDETPQKVYNYMKVCIYIVYIYSFIYSVIYSLGHCWNF